MRTNGDILGHLSKGVDNASIFVPQSDKTVTETPAAQAIETEFEMEFETENTEETDVSADEIEAEEIACYMGEGEPEMAQGITLGELAQMVQVIQIKQLNCDVRSRPREKREDFPISTWRISRRIISGGFFNTRGATRRRLPG